MSAFRPELHVTAEQGILEAAAGVLRDGDTWHVFYQYQPGPAEPSRWGHVLSEGSHFDWVECNDAIVPAGGETAVRAGSVVAARGGVDLYFTSVTATGTSIQRAHADDLETLCEDVNDDYSVSSAFQRHGDVIPDSHGLTRFRSPCVVPDWQSSHDRSKGEDGWLMLAVTGPTASPSLVVLGSSDGAAWTVEGELIFEGDPGFDTNVEAVVAPRIIRLRDEVDGQIYDVLLLTLERGGRDVTLYSVGLLHGTTFSVVTSARRIDNGHDFSRPRTTNYTPGTVAEDARYDWAFLFGSMTSSSRSTEAASEKNWSTEGWANALTLPRRVTLQGGLLFQTPAPGLPEAVDETLAAKLWTGLCEIPVGSRIVAEVLDGRGETAAVVTHSGDTITLDRLDGSPAASDLHDEDEDNVTIVVDGSTIEVFAGGGAVTLSSRFWPEGGCSGIRVRAEGEAEIYSEWRRGS
ncbi:Sucrose-6-phosphate hydrolase [Corynebacterium capitovis DSM 44611]|uniref:GH32 C-terminal domain-containing protein n=1 Tax=Corynebacterium capitovis TaxID=131081 RepID=UPI000373FB52|nr:GH32 C-terminal domain-containing protein [Corynebacterium capitovis]WKD57879.1 Sucrose-6-phosphate hydrolase [Corynebacterium capitovis DSM 44611]